VTYGQDFAGAARRHLNAGDVLYETEGAGRQPGCRAVAGYLFGLSGELAVKEIMRRSGMRPQSADKRREDPFYAHFPHLKTMLRDSATGRRAGELSQLAANPHLFENWNTDMRYAPTADIREAWVTRWRESAEDLVARMDIT
jgi:hypothetical protein